MKVIKTASGKEIKETSLHGSELDCDICNQTRLGYGYVLKEPGYYGHIHGIYCSVRCAEKAEKVLMAIPHDEGYYC